jgi:hypothetical protein
MGEILDLTTTVEILKDKKTGRLLRSVDARGPVLADEASKL